MEWVLVMMTLKQAPWEDKPFWSSPAIVREFKDYDMCDLVKNLRSIEPDVKYGFTRFECKMKERET
jgi:hypothetical protein